MKKLGQKTKFRVTFIAFAFIITSVFFVVNLFSYSSQINNTKKEIVSLEKSYKDSLAEEEKLKSDINKLQNPEYMAKYAREKYLYSKDDEIVIKIED